MSRNIGRYLLISLKGMAMGAADVVPGVSGGTIAFISGIYEELVESIKSINLQAIRILFARGIPSFWRHVNGTFLFSLVAGILFSVISLARLLEYLLVHHPVFIWSFFFGLVIASAIYVARTISRWNYKPVGSLITGTALAFVITSVSPAQTSEAYWFIFLSGALAICAMILPGISGSFILLLLGKYQFILNAVNELKLDIIAVLGTGAVLGIISFSNLLAWLLKKYHDLTIAMLSGFMIGSLNKIWPWKITIETFTGSHGELRPLVQKNVLPWNFAAQGGDDPQVLWAVLIAFCGFGIIMFFENLTKSRQQ
jgi:putative membrane protein